MTPPATTLSLQEMHLTSLTPSAPKFFPCWGIISDFNFHLWERKRRLERAELVRQLHPVLAPTLSASKASSQLVSWSAIWSTSLPPPTPTCPSLGPWGGLALPDELKIAGVHMSPCSLLSTRINISVFLSTFNHKANSHLHSFGTQLATTTNWPQEDPPMHYR